MAIWISVLAAAIRLSLIIRVVTAIAPSVRLAGISHEYEKADGTDRDAEVRKRVALLRRYGVGGRMHFRASCAIELPS